MRELNMIIWSKLDDKMNDQLNNQTKIIVANEQLRLDGWHIKNKRNSHKMLPFLSVYNY